MDALSKKNLISKKSRTDLLENKLVPIVPRQPLYILLKLFEDSADSSVKKVALGEPKAVPVGQYSEGVFQNSENLDKIKKKANYGSDVRQVLAWVESGEVDCGVVYMTDAKLSKKVKVVCGAPKEVLPTCDLSGGRVKRQQTSERSPEVCRLLKN